MKKTLSVAAMLLLTTNAFAADDPDRVEAPKANAPRVELSIGTSAHDLRTTTDNGAYGSMWVIPMMPTVDLRVSFPSSLLASGVGVRATWVLPTPGAPSTVLVDAFYSFGLRPKRLEGFTSSLTIDVGPSIASVGSVDKSWIHQPSYPAHVDIGATASLAWSLHFSSFFTRISGGYRAGLSTCGTCGVQWDGDAFASLDIGFALDLSSRRPASGGSVDISPSPRLP